MSILATIRTDLNKAWARVKKLEAETVERLVTSAEHGAIHAETLNLFDRLLTYVEQHLPEAGAAIGAVIGGPVGAAIGAGLTEVGEKVVQAVEQKVDAENPK